MKTKAKGPNGLSLVQILELLRLRKKNYCKFKLKSPDICHVTYCMGDFRNFAKFSLKGIITLHTYILNECNLSCKMLKYYRIIGLV